MEDQKIVALFLKRDPSAISEVSEKYSRYIRQIAMNILNSHSDAEEVENDTYERLWERIPPDQPAMFTAYIGKIAREKAIDRYRSLTTKKRGGGAYAESLEELEEVIGRDEVGEAVESAELRRVINSYLWKLPRDSRDVFVMRYFYGDPVKRIARSMGYSEPKVKSLLMRLRQGLKESLEEAGFTV